jgi:hypothetical protein
MNRAALALVVIAVAHAWRPVRARGDEVQAQPSSGDVPQSAGRLKEAERAYRDALSGVRKLRGESDPRVANAVIDLASNLDAQGRARAAEDLYRLEIDVSRKNADPANTRVLSTAFAEWLLKSRRPADAELLARGAFDLGLKSLKPGDWRLAHAKSLIGQALVAQKKFAQAEPLLIEAQKDLALAADAPSEVRQNAIRRLVDLYEAWERASPGQGKMAEAERWKARL